MTWIVGAGGRTGGVVHGCEVPAGHPWSRCEGPRRGAPWECKTLQPGEEGSLCSRKREKTPKSGKKTRQVCFSESQRNRELKEWVPGQFNGGEMVSQQVVLEQLDFHMQKNEVGLHLIPSHPINSNRTRVLKVSTKVLEKNIGVHVCDLDLGHYSLALIPKAQVTKEKKR